MLPKAARLRNGRDFRAVYARSRSQATPRLVLNVRLWRSEDVPGDAPGNARVRIGFSISKKTAKKAHERNLIKRRFGRSRGGRFCRICGRGCRSTPWLMPVRRHSKRISRCCAPICARSSSRQVSLPSEGTSAREATFDLRHPYVSAAVALHARDMPVSADVFRVRRSSNYPLRRGAGDLADHQAGRAVSPLESRRLRPRSLRAFVEKAKAAR